MGPLQRSHTAGRLMPRCLWTDAVASAGANQRSDALSARVTTARKKGRVKCHRQSSARLTS